MFDGDNFYDFDNLNARQRCLNNESGINWEINYAFYRKNDS